MDDRVRLALTQTGTCKAIAKDVTEDVSSTVGYYISQSPSQEVAGQLDGAHIASLNATSLPVGCQRIASGL